MTIPIQILLPALPQQTSPTRLARWCVAVGQQVTAGEVIAKITAGQSTMEIESTVSGRIERILVPEDTWGIPPNVAIALIEPEESDAGAIDETEPWQPLRVPTRPSASPPARAVAPPPIAESPRGARRDMPRSSPHREPQSYTQPDPSIAPPQPPQPAAPQPPPYHQPQPREQAQIAPPSIAGPLFQYSYRPRPQPELRPQPPEPYEPPSPPQAQRPPQPPPLPVRARVRRQLIPPRARGAFEPAPPARPRPATEQLVTPHTPETTARAAELEDAARHVPSARLTIDCAVGALARLRREHHDGHAEAPSLAAATSPGVVFAKALGMALADIPAANVTWTPQGLLRHRTADVAFAILLPEVQVTPVIRKADACSLDEIAGRVIDLTHRAHAKMLSPAELEGAAATILDLGVYGVRSFEPVIEPPRALALSLGAPEPRPAIVDGEIRRYPIITCTLAYDARAIPAAVAAELLATIKALVEEPVGLLLPASAPPLF